MSKIRFTVVGFGRIGKRHARIIAEHDDCELVAIVDKKDVRSDEEFPAGTPYFADLASALQQVGSDVVNICTPNGLHTSMALESLQAARNVVIEKPMGLSLESCNNVIATAKETGKNAFVVKQNRYSPPVKWLKDFLDQERLGKIFTVQINCFWNRSEDYYNQSDWKGTQSLDGGILYTQFSHFIDIMYWFFGDITDIDASTFKLKPSIPTEFEDTGSALFRFERGGMGQINFSTTVWDANLESTIRIIGEKGSVILGGQYMNEITYFHVEGETLPSLPETNPPNIYGKYTGSAANHHFVIQNVVDVLTKDGAITTPPMDGAKVVGIIERIYQSAKNH